jgi:hypothetical protein
MGSPRPGPRRAQRVGVALLALGLAACASSAPARARPSTAPRPRVTPPQTRSGARDDGACVGLVVETATRGGTRVETWSQDGEALEHVAVTWTAALEPDTFVARWRLDDAEVRVTGLRGDDAIALTHESPLGTFARAVPYGGGTALDLGPAGAWLPLAQGLRGRLADGAALDVRTLRLVGPGRAPRVELAALVARTSSGAIDVVVRRARRGGEGDDPDRVGLRLDAEGRVLGLGPPASLLGPGLGACPRPPALPPAAEVQASVHAALAARAGSSRGPAPRGPAGSGQATRPAAEPGPSVASPPEPVDPPEP